jgi:ABC-type sulfate/molybdate transport systems ATPase subunit
MLEVDVRKRLRAFELDVSFEADAGVTVVLGPSGSGKTTLLRLIAGLVRPNSGRIALDGVVLSDARTFVPPHRRKIGFVFQEYALFPHMSVAENVAYGLRAEKLSLEERRARAQRMLERLEIATLAGERVNEISGGQRQRVALGRALVIEPRALLLDEPLVALDPSTRDRVRRELQAVLNDVRVPALLVTHDESDRAAFPRCTIALEHGKLVAS